MAPLRFRLHSALTVAAVVAMLGAVPVAGAVPWLTPVLLLPLAVAVWSWRAGTDITENGMRVRALFGSRELPWSQIAGLAPMGRTRVAARLTNETYVILTAVRPADLPRLLTVTSTNVKP